MRDHTENARDIVRRLQRGEETRPLIVVVASLATGMLIGGLGVAAAWLFGVIARGTAIRDVLGLERSGVQDEDIGIGVIAAGVLWFAALVWIWRPVVRGRGELRGRAIRGRLARLVPATVGLAMLVSVAAWAIDTWQLLPGSDYVILGLCLLTGGVILLLWMPLIDACVFGALPVTQTQTNVVCPRCQYSMVGLRNAVCPECGQGYTLDELLGAQEVEEGG
ncbi:MAG: hypothetical protein KJO43_06850 [Phycisphaerae bacterium]|nr:hypothetical protein [Phycisphaerae bacterium]